MRLWTPGCYAAAIVMTLAAGWVFADGNNTAGLASAVAAFFALATAHAGEEVRDLEAHAVALAGKLEPAEGLYSGQDVEPVEHDHVHCTAIRVSEVARLLEPLREATLGQREIHIRDGICLETADYMAATFYNATIQRVLEGECVE